MIAFVLTLLYVATSLLSPGVFPEGAAALHINVILGVLVILTAVFSLAESKLATLPDGYLATGLLLATVTSTLATGWLGGAVSTFMEFVPILACFFFVAITCTTLRRINILVLVLVLAVFFILAQCVIADYRGILPDPYLLTENVSTGGILIRYRGLGMVADPNDLAQVMVTLTPLLFLRWKKGSSTANFLFIIVPAAVLATGVYFTHSRGGVFALIAVLVFGFKDKLSIIGSSILAGVALLAMLALNVGGGRGMGQDDGGRLEFWGTGLQTLRQHPIFGVGYGGFADYNHGRAAHNSFILAMVELGLVGYFFWMGMIVSSWSGLSNMIPSKAKLAKEKAKAAFLSARSARSQKTHAALSPLVGATVGAAQFSTRSAIQPNSPFPSSISEKARTWTPSPRALAEDSLNNDSPNDEQLIYAAKVVRTSLVGMLVAGLFLSRTYALILYVTLGIAVSLIRLSPRNVSLDVQALTKRTVLIMVASVVILYAFVRLHPSE